MYFKNIISVLTRIVFVIFYNVYCYTLCLGFDHQTLLILILNMML